MGRNTGIIKFLINSPRLRYAGRPSLLRKEGEKENLLCACAEKLVERSKDRMSKIIAEA